MLCVSCTYFFVFWVTLPYAVQFLNCAQTNGGNFKKIIMVYVICTNGRVVGDSNIIHVSKSRPFWNKWFIQYKVW